MANGDAFGFGTTLLGVTTRPPGDPRGLNATDTFAVDCTSATSEDGTDISAAWANELAVNLRMLARGNGNLLDGVTKIIAEDHSDGMLLAAVQQMMQRRRMNYCVDGGAANAMVASVVPAPVEMIDGFDVVIKAAYAPTGATTLALNGETARSVLRKGGGAITGGEWAAGDMLALRRSGSAWRLAGLVAADIATVPDAQLWHVAPSPAGGTANALTATCVPAITSYTHMANYLVVPNVTNTGSSTVAFNGLADTIIVNRDGSAVAAGQIQPNVPMWLVYFSSGTPYFVLMNAAAISDPARAKFWVEFDGTTTPPTIRKSFNVASVARLAQGTYKLTFTTAMPGADYAVSGVASNNSGYGCYVNLANVSYGAYTAGASPRTVNDVTFFTSAYSTGPLDNSFVSLIGFASA